MGGRWKFWDTTNGIKRYIFPESLVVAAISSQDSHFTDDLTGMDEVVLDRIRSWNGIPPYAPPGKATIVLLLLHSLLSISSS